MSNSAGPGQTGDSVQSSLSGQNVLQSYGHEHRRSLNLNVSVSTSQTHKITDWKHYIKKKKSEGFFFALWDFDFRLLFGSLL